MQSHCMRSHCQRLRTCQTCARRCFVAERCYSTHVTYQEADGTPLFSSAFNFRAVGVTLLACLRLFFCPLPAQPALDAEHNVHGPWTMESSRGPTTFKLCWKLMHTGMRVCALVRCGSLARLAWWYDKFVVTCRILPPIFQART